MLRTSAAVFLIVASGLVSGRWTNRWGPSPAVSVLASRFDSVPLVIGDWRGVALETAASERASAGADTCLNRIYTNSRKGASVSVLLLGGLPGKISTHTPEACYPGSGVVLSPTTSCALSYGGESARRAEFQTAVATRGGTQPSVLRIYWCWNASNGWAAPASPRWAYASVPSLCKLYVVSKTSGAVVDPGTDPCNDFLSVFLPELDRLVFAASR
jgi:hypothetical protein